MVEPIQMDSLLIAPGILQNLLDDFRSEINSTRFISGLRQFEDIINVLHKRDLLKNESILSKLFERFPDPSDQEKLKRYINYLSQGDCSNGNINTYAGLARSRSSAEAPSKNKDSKTIETTCVLKPNDIAKPMTSGQAIAENGAQSSRVLQDVFDFLAENVAGNWLRFGRRLGLGETDLCNIKSESDVRERLYKILDIAKQMYGNQIMSELERVLLDMRLRDFANKIIALNEKN